MSWRTRSPATADTADTARSCLTFHGAGLAELSEPLAGVPMSVGIRGESMTRRSTHVPLFAADLYTGGLRERESRPGPGLLRTCRSQLKYLPLYSPALSVEVGSGPVLTKAKAAI